MDPGDGGQRPHSPPHPSPVTVVAHRDGSRLELRLHGEADADTCTRLHADLVAELDEGVREVVVDVSTLSFCDLASSDVLHRFVDDLAAQAVSADVQGMSPLLTMIFTDFPPRRPAQVLPTRRVGRPRPAAPDAPPRGHPLELSGGHWDL